MAIQAKMIIPSKVAETVATDQYTSTNVTTIIDKFTATNTTDATLTLSINLIPNGDTVGDSNLVVDEKSILSKATYSCPEVVGHMLQNGAKINTTASGVGITIVASGRVQAV